MITHPVLTRLAMSGMKLGLERMQAFLHALGDPQLAAPVVHVAGTNGKGSVCTMVTEALVDAGLRVGTNTSPHLEHVNERFRLDGVPLDDAALDAALRALDDARREWAAREGLGDDALTYFELATALAFQVFAAEAVDVAVIEVGLGGRLDATNVVQPAVTAITSIGLDHVAQLGPTTAHIAAEKAGIVKAGVPLVLGRVDPEARRVILDIAHARGAPVWEVGVEITLDERAEGLFVRTPLGQVGPITLAMPGEHQRGNAAVAVGCLHALRTVAPVPDASIARGVGRARVAARVERLAPDLWVDGAHNEDGTRALAAVLQASTRPTRRVLLFGVGGDRDPLALLAALLPHIDLVVTTHCAHPAARPADEVAEAIAGCGVPVRSGGAVEDALDLARGLGDEVVAAGSLYLAGAVRTIVGAPAR